MVRDKKQIELFKQWEEAHKELEYADNIITELRKITIPKLSEAERSAYRQLKEYTEEKIKKR